MRFSELAIDVAEAEPGAARWTAATRALAEAAFSDDPELVRDSTQAIFAQIVEPWADRFDPALCERYVAFMSEALYVSNSPVRKQLEGIGYPTPQRLRERYDRVCRVARPIIADRDAIKRVVVLSRVTLGADIAVTSTVMQAARRAFPNAEVHFVGPRKNAFLVASAPGMKRRTVPYERRAPLADRLSFWGTVRLRVQQCVRGLAPCEWLVIDPDSRLTQLGLLPLVADDRRYRFFESRSYRAADQGSLGRLAALWCGQLLRTSPAVQPSVTLPARDFRKGEVLRRVADRQVAAVSFGVGGRASKRLGGPFEDAVLGLLRRRGYRIVLDYGAGDEEARLIDRRVRAFEGSTRRLRKAEDSRFSWADLVTWKGTLSGFGGWTSGADVFLGYDSAAAHLAAALGVPVIEVFAAAPNERMRRRWTPSGPGPVRVIPATGPEDWTVALGKVEAELARLEARRSGPG